MTHANGTGWVLFDKVEQKFLVHGNTVEYGYTSNPLEAHIYAREAVAYRRAHILLEGFLVNIARRPPGRGEKSKCELQLVPVIGVCGDSEDIVHVKKPRNTGFAIKVAIQPQGYSDVSKGFYKKPGGHSLTFLTEIKTWGLVEDDQDATMWKTLDTAQTWCSALEVATLNGGHKYKKFKIEVVPIK